MRVFLVCVQKNVPFVSSHVDSDLVCPAIAGPLFGKKARGNKPGANDSEREGFIIGSSRARARLPERDEAELSMRCAVGSARLFLHPKILLLFFLFQEIIDHIRF